MATAIWPKRVETNPPAPDYGVLDHQNRPTVLGYHAFLGEWLAVNTVYVVPGSAYSWWRRIPPKPPK